MNSAVLLVRGLIGQVRPNLPWSRPLSMYGVPSLVLSNTPEPSLWLTGFSLHSTGFRCFLRDLPPPFLTKST